MHAGFPDYFGMEGDAHTVPESHADDVSVGQGREHVGASGIANDRCSNKRCSNGLAPNGRHVDHRLERFDLSTERVAFDGDGQTAECLLAVDCSDQGVGEQDEAGARTEHGHATPNGGHDGIARIENSRELVDNARFTARDDEPVETVEVTRETDLTMCNIQSVENLLVFANVALKGEDTDYGRFTSHVRRGGAARGRRKR